jgi:hypothetical protein
MKTDRACFVLCVESGLLEPMTVRAVESLRLFGGRFASAPVLAITPRLGAPLSSCTRRRFRELDVEHVRLASRRRFSWYHYLNKPAALAKAEQLAATELIVFLDSDTLVLKDPEALDLGEGEGVAATINDTELGGTTGPGHPNEEAWQKICELVGLAPDGLPWVETPLDAKRIRLYFNSGVLAYRRSLAIGARQLELLLRVFDDGIRLPGSAGRMVEQVVLSPLVVARSLPWKLLPFSHNTSMISDLEYEPRYLREAHVLHYHDSMSPSRWSEFLLRMEAEQPRAASWLQRLGPIENPASRAARAVGECFRVGRGLRRRANDARLEVAHRIGTAQTP